MALIRCLWLLVFLAVLNYATSHAQVYITSDADWSSLEPALIEKLKQGDYSARGADACLGCHDDEEPFPTLDLFKTVHGHPEIPGSPFYTHIKSNFPEGLQCEACHGPAQNHIKKQLSAGESREPMVNFGINANVGIELTNELCLECHDDLNRTHWQTSAHAIGDLACTNCHEVHTAIDEVRHPQIQNSFCGSCHENVTADAERMSSHPLKINQLVCTDCHDPHGSKVADQLLLHEHTKNELCTTCHQELAGPFLWEHPPVAENCATCHEPHGSNNRSLLTVDVPQLCQSCHSSVGHRSLRMDPDIQPTEVGAEFLFLNACLNCHSSIHGSNHPSGNLFRR